MPQPARRYPKKPLLSVVTPAFAPTWDAAVERFLLHGQGNNLAGSTRLNYRSYLTGPRMRIFREDHGVERPADFSAEVMEMFKQELSLTDLGLAPATIGTYVRVLKNYLGFCVQQGIGPDEAVLKVRGPTEPEVDQVAFTPEEESRLLAFLKGRGRDEMIILLMLRSGMRVADVANTELDDCHLTDNPLGGYIHVREGKGRKPRNAPVDWFGDNFSKRLQRWIDKERKSVETSSRSLFVSTIRDPLTNDRQGITTRGLQMLCRRLEEEEALRGMKIHPHKFRRSFITKALMIGVDPIRVQRAVGHSTMEMVSRYARFTTDDLLLGARRV